MEIDREEQRAKMKLTSNVPSSERLGIMAGAELLRSVRVGCCHKRTCANC